MIIAAIDSGIDLVTVAVLDSALCPSAPVAGDPIGFTRAAAGLVRMLSIETSPADSTVARCASIARELAEELRGATIHYAIIEIPRNAYRSDSAIKRGLSLSAINDSLMLLNRGIGAIAAGLGVAERILETRAFGSRKEERRVEVNAALAAVGKPAVKNLDMSDAIHIGLVWMSEYLRYPDVFTRNVHRGELHHTWTAAELARRGEAEKVAQRSARPRPVGRGRGAR